MPSVLARLIAFLGQLSDRRFAAMLGLGFSSGIPFLLVYGTQSVWLTQSGISIETIGLMSELTLAYKLKFVWAPFLERFDMPVLGRWLGRRRGWIVLAQLLVIVCLVGIGFGDPRHWLAWTIAFSLALGFAGATQDVTIDGWRINAAPEQKAVMASWAEIGWRLGTFTASAGALYLSAGVGWRTAYLVMAALMVPGIVAALVAPEPEGDKVAATQPTARLDLSLGASLRDLRSYIDAPLRGLANRLRSQPPAPQRGGPRPAADAAPSLVATIVAPILELVTRLGAMALPILVLVAGFRMPGYVSSVMMNPLFVSMHYSSADIATVTKLFGFWIALAATATGGILVPRIGMMASLVVGTIFGSASHLALAWLASHGSHAGFWPFAIAVSIDSFAYALASIILITYMSTLVREDMAASQYALLTSLVALPGSLLAACSGFVIKRVGFESFFIGTSLIGLPVAILCLWVWRQHVGTRPGVPAFE